MVGSEAGYDWKMSLEGTFDYCFHEDTLAQNPAVVQLLKFAVRAGDVLVLRVDPYPANGEVGHLADTLKEAFSRIGITPGLVCILEPGMELSALPTEDMARQGWIRAPAVEV